MVVELEIRPIYLIAEIPRRVPVRELEPDSAFAGYTHRNTLVERHQIECFFGAERMTDRSDAAAVDLRHAQQNIHTTHRVVEHLAHAQRVRMSLSKSIDRLAVIRRVLPQET